MKKNKRKEDLLKNRRLELEADNNLRLEKNVFTMLSLFKAKNGALSRPALLNNLKRVFKFDIDKVMSGPKEKDEETTQIAKITKSEERSSRSGSKKTTIGSKNRHLKYCNKLAEEELNQPKTLNGETQQNIISQLKEYNKNILLTDYKFPCLFRISKMNLEKKQSLSEKIKKGEEEVVYLDEDIKKLELELIKIQTKRSQIEIRSKVNQVRLNVSDELYNLYRDLNIESVDKSI